MDPERVRALVRAHPAVAIPAFGTRRDVVCVRVADLRRLVGAGPGVGTVTWRVPAEDGAEGPDQDVPEPATPEPGDDALDAAVAALGGERVRLVDPASTAADAGRGRPRGAARRGGPRAGRPRRSSPVLSELDVYELPAAVLSDD